MTPVKPALRRGLDKELAQRGYTILEELTSNEGPHRMTTRVYKALHTDGRTDALKISSIVFFEPQEVHEVDKYQELALREKAFLEKLTHPNIPKYRGSFNFTIDEDIDNSALATEYIDAPNLQTRIRQGKKATEQETRILLEDGLKALDHVHSQQIVHRDIKPSNILFDGRKGYIFDFNYSAVNDNKPSSTIIETFGYYPQDAYLDIPTPSQDLYALGTTIIASAFGKDISEIRDEQRVKVQDSVSLEKLSLRPNLKIFLRKLTSQVPALRYQTAADALADLRKLDTINPADLEKKLKETTRSKEVQTLLKLLEEEDGIFSYNVPPAIIEHYDDWRLLDHLDRTYAKPEFVIENEEEVESYAEVGDRVQSRADFNGHLILKTGDEATVQKEANGKATISVNSNTLECEPSALRVTKMINKTWWSQSWIDVTDEKYLSNIKPDLWNLCHVKYTGEPVYNDLRLVKGAVGIIFGEIANTNEAWKKNSGEKVETAYAVAWESAPGINIPINPYAHNSQAFTPSSWFSADFLKLVLRNHIDYTALKEKAFSKETAPTK